MARYAPADRERGPFEAFSGVKYLPRVQADMDGPRCGMLFAVAWEKATSELLDEVQRGQLDV
jgi:hypothetical protein